MRYHEVTRRLDDLERQSQQRERAYWAQLSDAEFEAAYAEMRARHTPEENAAMEALSDEELELACEGIIDGDEIMRRYRARQGHL
jgi:hypothetical protein